jgi:hypothetical protein
MRKQFKLGALYLYGASDPLPVKLLTCLMGGSVHQFALYIEGLTRKSSMKASPEKARPAVQVVVS